MDGAVYQFNPLRNSFTAFTDAQFLNNGYLTPDSNILITTRYFLHDGKDVYPLFDTRKTAPGNILFRPRVKLWENHHRELHYYDVSRWVAGKPPRWDLSLPQQVRLVYPFLIDRSGIVWSGSVGYGLRKYTTAGNQFTTQLPGYSVRWIVPGKDGDVFVGDFAYGWRRLKGDNLEPDPFAALGNLPEIDNFLIARNGSFWLKSDKKGYVQYHPLHKKTITYPQLNGHKGIGDKQPMLEDSKGWLWFPGMGGHIVRIHPASGKTDSVSLNTSTTKPMLPRAVVTALYEDVKGHIWIGTQEGCARLVYGTTAGAPPRITWYYNSSSSRNSLSYNLVSSFWTTRPSRIGFFGSAPRAEGSTG